MKKLISFPEGKELFVFQLFKEMRENKIIFQSSNDSDKKHHEHAN